MLISQISQVDGRAAGLLAEMVSLHPIFQVAQFRKDASTFLSTKEGASHTGSAARAEGAAAQRDAQTPSTSQISLALYSREIVVDNLRRQDVASGAMTPNGLRKFYDRQLKKLLKKFAAEIQLDMFQGTNAANRMLGLSSWVKDAAAGGQTAAMGFTAAEQAAMNVNISLQLNTEANRDLFIENLEEQITTVPNANAIMVNQYLYARINTIARRYAAIGTIVNDFGKQVATLFNIPIYPFPTSVIPQTESDGVNADCTSMYIARFAEELGVCFSTNSGFLFTDFEDVDDLPSGLARMEMYTQLVAEETDAFKRLSRIRL